MSRPELPPEEPPVGPWRLVPLTRLLATVRAAAGAVGARPVVLAVDGRSGSGKTTLAERLHQLVPRSHIVHTDDLAWHEPFFEWGDLLLDGILRPLHRGEAIAFRPPQWDRRRRPGAIEVPAGAELVIVEGAGASHREHGALVDATLWVQTPMAEAERRGIARDVADGGNGDERAATAFWHEWMRHELAFFRRQRPWERALAIVRGTAGGASDEDLVEIADPPS